MAFIGRDDDLKQLQECFTERRAQLVFVYGRRRVGKTETLIQLAKDKETDDRYLESAIEALDRLAFFD